MISTEESVRLALVKALEAGQISRDEVGGFRERDVVKFAARLVDEALDQGSVVSDEEMQFLRERFLEMDFSTHKKRLDTPKKIASTISDSCTESNQEVATRRDSLKNHDV